MNVVSHRKSSVVKEVQPEETCLFKFDVHGWSSITQLTVLFT